MVQGMYSLGAGSGERKVVSMRIAIFTETFLPKLDGIVNTVCYLLEHLADCGHKSIMFAPEGAPSHYAETAITRLAGITFPLYPELKLVPPILDVEKELIEFQPDLVFVLNPCSLGLIGLRHARALDLPVVASYHTDIPGYAERYGLSLLREPLWAYFRWLHNQADLNLCPSHFTKTELKAHGFERLKVWTRGIDSERFHPHHRNDAWRERLSGGTADGPILLYVGRLAHEKRVEWLRPVLDAVPQARLALVGDGPARPMLEALFAGTNTVFTGYLRGKDLSHAYASSDIFLFPSANETFGNVVLEAMASGLPVVVSRSGGPVDHIIDGKTGFFADPIDPTEFIATVKALVMSPEKARAIGRQARAQAETRTWETIFEELLKDLAQAIHDYKAQQQRSIWAAKKLRTPKPIRSARNRTRPRRDRHVPLWAENTRSKHGTPPHSRHK
jgi:glycosyltransferase involved in cell wall biosynthesis